MTCTHPREVIAIDSSGHKIIPPCAPCHRAKLDAIGLALSPQRETCDECGGGLEALKEGLRCVKCGLEYR